MIWADATPEAVLRILRNPAYGGLYVYGRTQIDSSRDASPTGRRRQIPRHPGDHIVINDHHEPFVPPEVQATIWDRLAKNSSKTSPAPGRGESLLQGLLHCTVHQCTFITVYRSRGPKAEIPRKRAATYCCGSQLRDPYSRCSKASARVVDQLIETEILAALCPPTLDDVAEALRKEQLDHAALLRQRQHELACAEQEVHELEREIHRLGPEHEHYRQRLRDRIELAIKRHTDILAVHKLRPIQPPSILTDNDLAELRRLLDDLPRVWRHPKVSAQQRKQLVRHIITEVRVTPTEASWILQIGWSGGDTTTAYLPTYVGVLETIRREYRERRSTLEIADNLNSKGIVQRSTSASGEPFTGAIVRRHVSKLRLQAACDEITYPHIAERFGLGVSHKAIAEGLNILGLRHRLGIWTAQRVAGVIVALRARGRLPPVHQPDQQVLALHNRGLFPAEIARALASEGVLSRLRKPVTLGTVRHVLRRHGTTAHSVQTAQRIKDLLSQEMQRTSVRELTARLNELKYRPQRGEHWTVPAVSRKLARLGLRVQAKEHIDDLLRVWSGENLTTVEMRDRLIGLGLLTSRGRNWSESTVRWRLAAAGLKPSRHKVSRLASENLATQTPQGSQLPLPIDEAPWPGK